MQLLLREARATPSPLLEAARHDIVVYIAEENADVPRTAASTPKHYLRREVREDSRHDEARIYLYDRRPKVSST